MNMRLTPACPSRSQDSTRRPRSATSSRTNRPSQPSAAAVSTAEAMSFHQGLAGHRYSPAMPVNDSMPAPMRMTWMP